jgi:hypothetical protein
VFVESLKRQILESSGRLDTHGVKSQFAVRDRDFSLITASGHSEICYILKVPLFLHPGLFSVYMGIPFQTRDTMSAVSVLM